MAVKHMYPAHEVARQRQQTMLMEAAAQREALRVHALAKATRRAERAQRRLARSRRKAMRLQHESGAEQGS